MTVRLGEIGTELVSDRCAFSSILRFPAVPGTSVAPAVSGPWPLAIVPQLSNSEPIPVAPVTAVYVGSVDCVFAAAAPVSRSPLL